MASPFHRILLAVWLVLLPAFSAAAEGQRVRSLKMYVDLKKDGTASVYERWDVSTGTGITEWYLVRENLGDIVVDSLEVAVDDVPLHNEGEWEVDRTLEQKAGRCGIVHKYNGVELCWGIGSYGDHVFEALYQMHGAVKSARDYDYLHLQLVSPGLSSPPEQVTVYIGSKLAQLDTTVARAWGFGYVGTCLFSGRYVVFESDGALDTEDSVIALLRLEKGIFEPTSVRDQDFQEVLDRAMEGADFGSDDEEGDLAAGIIGLATIVFLWWYIRRKVKQLLGPSPQNVSQVVGAKEKTIPWYRDIPLGGNLPAANYILEMIGERSNDTGPLTSALILRMVYNGYLEVSRLLESKDTELRFTAKDPAGLDKLSRELYKMLMAAAGENQVLEKSEFTAWARENKTQVYKWSSAARETGLEYLKEKDYKGNATYSLTASGKLEAQKLLGLRKFLKEFTLTKEREAFEAHLWKEYLVFGAVLGVAERVARQLKEIAPEYGSVDSVLDTSKAFSRAVCAATALYRSEHIPRSSYSGSSYSSSSSRGGYGGHSSHSGGHGYSGGGRGGGGR